MKPSSFVLTALLLSSAGCAYINGDRAQLPEAPKLTTTGVAAATGAVIGGGLGAIVGSENGSAGGGLVIGSLAGAAAGGLVGRQMETQEVALAEQRTKLSRQDTLLKQNRSRIDELKRHADDQPKRSSSAIAPSGIREGYRGSPRARPFQETNASTVRRGTTTAARRALQNEAPLESSRARMKAPVLEESITPSEMPTSGKNISGGKSISGGLPPPKTADSLAGSDDLPVIEPKLVNEENGPSIPPALRKKTLEGKTAGKTPTVSEAKITEESITDDNITEEKISSNIRHPAAVQTAGDVSEAVLPAVGTSSLGGDCQKAGSEAGRARTAPSEADKLFYYRRALRLCPKQAGYHLELGKVYQSIGRVEDAEYEFRQTLDLDPQNADAQRQLSALSKDNNSVQ